MASNDQETVFHRHFPFFAGLFALANLAVLVVAGAGWNVVAVGVLGVAIPAAFELEVLIKRGI